MVTCGVLPLREDCMFQSCRLGGLQACRLRLGGLVWIGVIVGGDDEIR